MTNSTKTQQPLHFAAAAKLNVGDKILTGDTHATIVEMRWSRNRRAVTIDYRLDFNGNLLSIGGPASMTFRIP